MYKKNRILGIVLFMVFLEAACDIAAVDKPYGEWIAKTRDDGLQFMLIRFVRNDTKRQQWLSTVLLKNDEYSDLEMLKDPNFKVEWILPDFIRLDEFTGFEFGKELDFKAQREAGTLALHGKVTGVKGSGSFEFTPDPAFLDYLKKQGYNRFNADEVLHMFRASINKAYFDDLRALGYNHLSTDRLMEFVIHGVAPEFVQGMNEYAGKRISPEELISCKIHGVSPEYAGEIRELGFNNIPVSRLQEFKIHGVSVELIQAVRDAGYKDVSPEKLIELKIHGASPDFIRQIQSLGYQGLPLSKLVEFRIHGVSPQFIREIHEAGFKDISPNKLVEFRIHGVSPQFIKEIHEAGFKDISPDKLIEFRIHGVTGQKTEPAGKVFKATGKEDTSSKKAKGIINIGSISNNKQGLLQLSNSMREISLFHKGWNFMPSPIIHTYDLIQLHFQSTKFKAKVSLVVEPRTGPLPNSQNKAWETLKQSYKNYTIRPESWVYGEIDGLPSTTYIADYDKEGKKMIEYCTYMLNKQYVGLFELHVEKKAFDKIKPGFDSMIQSFKWKEK